MAWGEGGGLSLGIGIARLTYVLSGFSVGSFLL